MYRCPDKAVRAKSIERGGPLGAKRDSSRGLEFFAAFAGWAQLPHANGKPYGPSWWRFAGRIAVQLFDIARASWRVTRQRVRRFFGVDDGERRIRLAAYAVVLIGAVCAAQAEQHGAGNTMRTLAFHIPAQPLANALQEYGQKAGIQVLYESNSAVGRVSSAVDGDFTPGAALELLLSGSGLRVRYSGPEAVTLANPSGDPSAADDGPPSHPLARSADLSLGTLRVRGEAEDVDEVALREFSATVQSDIERALRRSARTRGGNYRLVLDLWVDASRIVQRTELARSTGDRERDATVQEVLQGLVISRPAPPKTPQPVRVVIAVKALQ
jgi:hypothetical protein